MSTSMLLFSVLNCKAEHNYYTQQLVTMTNLLESNAAKLEQQTELETQYNKAYDDALDPNKKIAGVKEKDQVLTECQAAEYAHSKVRAYDESLLEELNELDLRYETRKASLETQIKLIETNQSSLESRLGSEAQKTNLLS